MTEENKERRYNTSRGSYNNNREGYRAEGNNNRQGGYNRERSSYENREPRQRISRTGNSRDGENRPYTPRFRSADSESRPSYQRDNNGYQGRRNDSRNSYSQDRPYSQSRNSGYKDERNGERRTYAPRTEQGGYSRGYSNRDGERRDSYSRPRFSRDNAKGDFRPRTADYDPSAKYSAKKRYEYKEQNIDPDAPIRLNKYLSNAGVCSRRDADKYIQAGVVRVNGEVITELGTKVKRSDDVKFHDDTISPEKKVYVLLNKPKDCVTTSDDPQNRKTVMDLVRGACKERIYPVGRLDRNTTGVLILTNDGDMASKLTHPKFQKKKIYHVYTDKSVTLRDLQQISEGIELEDGIIKADRVEYASDVDKKQVGIEIHSGKNRIVRRIFESLGYKVIKLDRVYFAGLTKKNLRRGEWRHLTEQEVNILRMGAFE